MYILNHDSVSPLNVQKQLKVKKYCTAYIYFILAIAVQEVKSKTVCSKCIELICNERTNFSVTLVTQLGDLILLWVGIHRLHYIWFQTIQVKLMFEFVFHTPYIQPVRIYGEPYTHKFCAVNIF